MKPRGAGSVTNARAVPDGVDDFPTPCWATRALVRCVLPTLGLSVEGARVWEPAAGRGIMSLVLEEFGARVFASDVIDYGCTVAGKRVLDAVGSFVGEGPDVMPARAADWIVTNPPFRLAADFFERGISEAPHVALLLRSNWAEGVDRYERIFSKHPPLAIAQFVERVPMVRGRWDPDATTATAYAWFVWLRGASVGTRMLWIPPGQRQALTYPDDRRRFAVEPEPDML